MDDVLQVQAEASSNAEVQRMDIAQDRKMWDRMDLSFVARAARRTRLKPCRCANQEFLFEACHTMKRESSSVRFAQPAIDEDRAETARERNNKIEFLQGRAHTLCVCACVHSGGLVQAGIVKGPNFLADMGAILTS